MNIKPSPLSPQSKIHPSEWHGRAGTKLHQETPYRFLIWNVTLLCSFKSILFIPFFLIIRTLKPCYTWWKSCNISSVVANVWHLQSLTIREYDKLMIGHEFIFNTEEHREKYSTEVCGV